MDLITGSGTGLQAHYFNGIAESYGLQPSNSSDYGLKLTDSVPLVSSRIDSAIDFQWNGGQVSPSVQTQNFSAEWTGKILAPESGKFTFTTNSDDGIRVWVDGKNIIDAWNDHAPELDSGAIDLVAGQKYDIKVDYYQRSGGSIAQLFWAAPDIARQIVPQSYLYVPEAQPASSVLAPTEVVPTGTGLQGQYFNGIGVDATKLAITRTDSSLNFDWKGGKVDPLVSANDFTAEWTGQVLAPKTGKFTFTTNSDDGIRVWVDGKSIIDAWNDHAPELDSGAIDLVAGQKYDIKVDYYQRSGGSIAQLFWAAPGIDRQIVSQGYLYAPAQPPVFSQPPSAPQPIEVVPTGTGLQGQYFNGIGVDATKLAVTRTDSSLNFDWKGGKVDPLVSANDFTAEWTGQVLAPKTGKFTFTTNSDDGIRVWVDGKSIIDAWNDHAPELDSGAIDLVAGQKYDIKVDYYQRSGGSIAQLFWAAPGIDRQIVSQGYLYAPTKPISNPSPVVPPADPLLSAPIHSDPSPIIPAQSNVPVSNSSASNPPIPSAFYDSTLPGEGYPSGVPSYYDWATKPILGYGNNVPSGWNAFTAWGQLYVEQGWNPPANGNTRVQIGALDAWYLSKSTNKWVLLQHADQVSGAAYVEDFANDANKIADIRDESANGGGISVTAGNGYNFHFWTSRATLPDTSDIAGVYTRFQSRLILADSSGVDDRDSTRYLASDGADYWRSLYSGWASDWSNNGGVASGRFKFVTNNWQDFAMSTLTPEQLIGNPPPV